MYYHCTRGKDKDCKERAIREEELTRQLVRLIDKIDIDEIGAQEQIKKEIDRYKRFSYGVLGRETEFDKRPIETDIRNYAKYILNEGTKEEKRELLGCFKSELRIKNREVYLTIGKDFKKVI